MIIQIDDVLVSMDILTENFCCDLSKCKGQCCVEGDAGAPITLDEMGKLEEFYDVIKPDMSVEAQLVVAAQGVGDIDQDGDLVTSIVNGRDCVFTCYQDLKLADDNSTADSDGGSSTNAACTIVENCCTCAYEKAFRNGKINWCKPISCALYPIRESQLSNGLIALVYHRWDVCKDAVRKGNALQLPIYKFLKEPLIRRFGEEWYEALCIAAKELAEQQTKTKG